MTRKRVPKDIACWLEQKELRVRESKLTAMLMMAAAMVVISNLHAGDLNPSGPPGSTMYSLEDIYLAVVGD